jgi:membrane protease YdiL (CAAX protease family)
MKIAEALHEELALDNELSKSAWPVPPRPIAPWWHTIVLIAFLVTESVLTGRESKAHGMGGSHIHRYLLGIVLEWVLAALAWWGIRMGHVPVRQLLGQKRKGWKEWARDFGIALLFWFMATMVLAAIATILRLLHLVPLQKAVFELAPQSAAEIALWLVLCVTAGMVEEFVFRGYLLQQFASLPVVGVWAESRIVMGAASSSLVFGLSHGYEGIGGMIAITVYGALFCILCVRRGSLRAGMMAHTWQDSIAGIALALLKHLRVI